MKNGNAESYTPPFFLFNGHLETIYPSLFRKTKEPAFLQERTLTPDNDFLDVYRFSCGATKAKAVIISHGLEGNAWRPYVLGMVNAFCHAGFDVVTWNFRGCGPEINRQLRFYHSGATEDLETIVRFTTSKGYEDISLIGFSLGGNVTLKYLGEERILDPSIKKAVAISVPMDLFSCSLRLSQPSNRVYEYRFLKSLKEKIIKKSRCMKGLDIDGIHRIKTIMEFDDRYTAPLHGFSNAMHYYGECSSIKVVENIKIPTLIINAKNDPFLSPSCYPTKLLMAHPCVQFESPARGGHVGFAQFNKNGLYWSEERALNFLT